MDSATHDAWTEGQAYDAYMGRWSRRLAQAFLAWIEPPAEGDWIDVGCGTGALTAAAVAGWRPRSVLSLDPAEGFLEVARGAVPDPRVTFVAGDALQLPTGDASVDVAVSALVINFVPDPAAALAEMRRVLRPGGLLGFCVWDYPGGGLGFVDAFWKEAAGVDPRAAALDEATRFEICSPDGLLALCAKAGLARAGLAPLTVATDFADFADYWRPFTLGAGPAPGFCRTLAPEAREALRDRLAARLGPGPIRLPARAWAVRARV